MIERLCYGDDDKGYTILHTKILYVVTLELSH